MIDVLFTQCKRKMQPSQSFIQKGCSKKSHDGKDTSTKKNQD